MALSHSLLATGQLTAAGATIYTVPAATTAYVKSIYFHNTNATAETVRLHINGSTTATRVLNTSVNANDTFEFAIAYNLTLTAAQTLFAGTTTSAVVNFWIYGATE